MARSDRPAKKRVHIWMNEDQIAQLHHFYDATIGFSRAIQIIIDAHLSQIKAKHEEGVERASFQLPPGTLTDMLTNRGTQQND